MNTLIENWMLCRVGNRFCLMGKITGHPDPEVGVKDCSLTSPIVEYDFLGTVITESGTHYTIGEPADSQQMKWLQGLQIENAFQEDK